MKNNTLTKRLFPWAGIDEALTMAGLLAHRETMQRKTWGLVIAGEDAALVEAAMTLEVISPANNAATDGEIRGFLAYILKCEGAEALFTQRYPVDAVLSAYLAGRRDEFARVKNNQGDSGGRR